MNWIGSSQNLCPAAVVGIKLIAWMAPPNLAAAGLTPWL